MRSNGGQGWVPFWLPLVVGTVVAAVVAQVSGTRGWAAVFAACGVGLSLAGYLKDRQDSRASDTDMATLADRLADQVRKQWDAEARHREISDPALPVSWRPADSSLVQSWHDLERLAASGGGWASQSNAATGPAYLAGSGPDLIRVLERVPTGRLVVLGEPGSGKTVLLIRLVLDLLARRESGQPVPFLVPLASWDPGAAELYSWLAGQILREQPWLASTAVTGARRVRALLDAGLILPVLDGLDEIHAARRDQALAAINTTLREGDGLILSCRAKSFRHAVRPAPGRQPVLVRGAAGIRLDPLSVTAVADYLTETAGDGREAYWAPVRTALATVPAPPIARALTTPLMASLARVVYNPTPGGSALNLPNPADLCNTTALPTRAVVEQHLFDGLIPAAYRPLPDRPSRWTREQVEPALIFLAQHLEFRLRTTSLAWWELRFAMLPALRVLAAVILAVPVWFTGWFALKYGGASTENVRFGFPLLLFGLTSLGILSGRHGYRPRRVGMRTPRPHEIAIILALPFGVGLALGHEAGLKVGLPVGLGAGSFVLLAATFGLGGFVKAGLRADTRSVFVDDRQCALMTVLVFGLSIAFAAGLPTWLNRRGDATFVTIGVACIAAIEIGLSTAWGQFLLARLWLAARGKTPLRLMTFLEDAHARGVLRQVGAVYEFRHIELQRRLANRP